MLGLRIALALLGPLLAAAAPVVVSPAADDVALTIDGSGRALVRETRSVDLPLGPSTIEFRGVSDAIVPEAAVLEGLDGVVERNFDYDVLSPYSLLRKAIGQRATLVRTHPGSGAVTRQSGTLRSTEAGVIVDLGGGRSEALDCSGLPEGLVLEGLPPGLRAEPTLSVRVRSQRAGPRTLTLLYLADGLAWKADYNLELSPRGDRFDLEAWLTLANEGGTTFEQAHAAVLAGELTYVSESNPRPPTRRESGCWAAGRRWRARHDPSLAEIEADLQGQEHLLKQIEEITVTARKREEVDGAIALREQLLDYHLYRVPWRTTVAARQSKQVRFLERRGIPAERIYRFSSDRPFDEPAGLVPATVTLRFRDRTIEALKEPLPAGTVRVTQAQDGGASLRVGHGDLPSTPADLPVSIDIARSTEVHARRVITEMRTRSRPILSLLRGEPVQQLEARIEHMLVNDKDVPARIELRNPGADRIRSSSHPWTRDRDTPVWRLELPARSTTILSYRARYEE